MKVLGIVAEYNPFHNGHKYHIEQSKAITGCNAVVCVMSGNFIQRGEPALINKFSRAEIALQNGVDLVIELPFPFSVSSAEAFGSGAVKILDSIGIVDCISFGSEHGDIFSLQGIAEILVNEPLEYKAELKKQLSSGLSFPACRQIALQKYIEANQSRHRAEGHAALLETSNNILAIEYLKALIKLKSNIKPYTVKRISNNYNSNSLTGDISSATAIRNRIIAASLPKTPPDIPNLCTDVIQAIPLNSIAIIEKEFKEGRGPISMNHYEDILLAILRQTNLEKTAEIPGVSEGLEYRIKKASELSGDLKELYANICTKRYTKTRIQRILVSLLAGITKNDINLFLKYGGPQYARILGFNNTGRQLLAKMKTVSTLPIITKPSDYKKSCNNLLSRMLELEAYSSDMYVLGYKNPIYKKAGQEFTHNIIRCL